MNVMMIPQKKNNHSAEIRELADMAATMKATMNPINMDDVSLMNGSFVVR